MCAWKTSCCLHKGYLLHVTELLSDITFARQCSSQHRRRAEHGSQLLPVRFRGMERSCTRFWDRSSPGSGDATLGGDTTGAFREPHARVKGGPPAQTACGLDLWVTTLSRRNLRTWTAPALQFFVAQPGGTQVETALRSCGQAPLFALTIDSTRRGQWKRPRLLSGSKMQEVTDFRSSPSDRSCQSPERSKFGNKRRLSCFHYRDISLHHNTLTTSVLDIPTVLRRAKPPPPRTNRYRPIPGVSEQPRGPPGPPCEQRNGTIPAALRARARAPRLRACRASPSRPRGPPVAAGSPCPPRAAPRTAAPARRAPSAPAPGRDRVLQAWGGGVLIPCSV